MRLYDIIKSVAKKTNIDYEEITKLIDHRGEKGTAREDLIKEFLLQYLPQNFGIERGLIINSNLEQSNQQDLYIYDKSITPRFIDTEHVKVVPVESIVSIIEVKSELTTEELKSGLDNICRVRSMEKSFIDGSMSSYFPLGYILAFKSQITLNKIKEELTKYSEAKSLENFPTLIVVLDRGVVSMTDKNNPMKYQLSPNDNTIFAISENEEQADNLMIFYLLCSYSISIKSHRLDAPDLAAYAQKSGFANLSRNFHRDQFKGVTIDFEGNPMSIDGMCAAQAFWKEVCDKGEHMKPENYIKLLILLAEALPDMKKDVGSIIDAIKGKNA